MKRESRIQNSEFRMTHWRPAYRVATFLLASGFWILNSAFGATHVTATYDLGANPHVMATVNGHAEYGLVFAERNKPVTYNGVEYGPSVVKGYLDASGQLNDGKENLWLDLIPNLGATPGDSYYVVTFNIQGRVHAEIWVVPDMATVGAEICQQSQAPSSGAPALYYQLLQQAGEDLPQRQKLNLTGSGISCVDNAGQLRTDCTISGGGSGSAPLASPSVSGTVKIDAPSSDPVVYLKATSDSLLAGKASSVHTHSENDVTNLTTDLAGKAPLTHAHAESDVTNLVTDLAAKVPTSRTVSTSSPLSGGGALSSNLTLSCPTCEVTGNKNAASGYAGLDASTKLAGAQIPYGTSANTAAQGNDSRITGAEQTANKNTASGYAGLTASTKLNAAQGQEVWGVTDLTDYSATSGSGTTALKTTISAPADAQCLVWSAAGSNWVNGACAGGGGGDNISVNGTAASDADFDDATPAAPANSINVKWQKDALSPNNISANVPYAAPLTVTGGNLTSSFTAASADTLTNKTLDAEAAGNILTTVSRIYMIAAGCDNATAAAAWDLPASGAAGKACLGSGGRFGALIFADAATSAAYNSIRLPADWMGNVDLTLLYTGDTNSSNNIHWQVSTACVADGEDLLSPTFNTASASNSAGPTTAGQRRSASFTSVPVTNCAAGETMFLKFERIGADAGDTYAGVAQLLAAELTLRRAQ